ncbi:plasmid pRiA4b ORF-3 family protein [Sutcliffiella sp. NPDC057660]|uniref:plasmid pRiA4b ORF-3 family protein n=1 Tax=Sutcliffiella sp. NPDC057660 TaxID=3346199 RepID=UPI00367FFAB6
MLIQCTKKLLDELKVTPEAPLEVDPLFAWHANVLKLGRKKALVLVNDKNRYVIVLYGLKAKEWKNIDVHIKEAIREVLQAECIKEELIEKFISSSDWMVFSKTKDRTAVARLNNSSEFVYHFGELIDSDSIVQKDLSLKISTLLVGDGKKSYYHPNEALYKELEELSGQPVFHTEAVQLKVTLELRNHKVWRRIIVPTNITFSKLHEVLQAAFGWQNYHLHDFLIFPPSSVQNVVALHQNKPVVHLVCTKEAFQYQGEIPMKMETGVKLSDYLPSQILYNYDFGDDWTHKIEVEKVIENHDQNRPVCLAGQGSTPPEDVGGEPGYELFLQIIQDKKHPDHEYMMEWGEDQGYEGFNLDEVNWRLDEV